jgi:hypothetical protein
MDHCVRDVYIDGMETRMSVPIPFLNLNYEAETSKVSSAEPLAAGYSENYLGNIMPKWDTKNEDGSDVHFYIILPMFEAHPKSMVDNDPHLIPVSQTKPTTDDVACKQRPNSEILFVEKGKPEVYFAAQFPASVVTLYNMEKRGRITTLQLVADVLHFGSLIEEYKKDKDWGHKVHVVPFLKWKDCHDTITKAINRYKQGKNLEWYKKLNTLSGG